MSDAKTNLLQEAFRDLTGELDRLVRAGYRSSSLEICRVLSGVTTDDLALHWFLSRCANNPRAGALQGAQSFVAFRNAEYTIRLNLWYPPTANTLSAQRRVDDYLSIDVCHNHAVDFFTVGVLGPGYASRFQEASGSLVGKTVGDTVEFGPTWDLQLSRGTSVFVEKIQVFHVQYAPEAFSVSLNLIPLQLEDGANRQLMIGRDLRTIERVVNAT